jgi:hypothetical protein
MSLFFGFLFASLAPLMPGYAAMAGLGAVALIIGGIIGGAIWGFIYGAVIAFLYNIFAGWVGGVQLDLV